MSEPVLRVSQGFFEALRGLLHFYVAVEGSSSRVNVSVWESLAAAQQ